MPDRTVRLHRVIRATPEKLYRAFTEAEALAKWLPPYGFTCTVHHPDATVGGSFRMSFRNFSTGNSHAFGGEYLELVPHRLIRYTDRFDDPNLPGVIEVTVRLEPGPAARRCGSSGRAYPGRFCWRCAISAGRNRWRSSPRWWSRTFPAEPGAQPARSATMRSRR